MTMLNKICVGLGSILCVSGSSGAVDSDTGVAIMFSLLAAGLFILSVEELFS